MAGSQELKRKHPEDRLQNNPLAKRVKSANKRNFSSAFWDRLSKVPLTRRALRELDYRNSIRPLLAKTTSGSQAIDIHRYARRGGPDLCHLRGYQEPKNIISGNMSSSRSSTSRSEKSKSTKATTAPRNKSKRSSAYGNEFEQHLADHKIYLPGFDDGEPKNMDEIQQALLAERASLSPSRFPNSAFQDFRQKNRGAVFESDVMSTVIPVICGTSDIPSQQNALFTELTPITDEDTVKPKPDFFDGARLHELGQGVREDRLVQSTAIPTKHASVPVVPNFYMEVKGRGGSAAVAEKQACYHGAYGARAMQVLQSHGEEEPIYDGSAYTLSSTYNSGTGTLQLFAHHVTEPTIPSEQPEYRMTQIDGWQMTGNINTFRRGASAFRNARDLASKHRNGFVQAANSRTSQLDRPEDVDSAGVVNYTDRQDADDALQQHVAGTNYAADDDVMATNAPHYLYTGEGSQGLSEEPTSQDFDRPSVSFASSFTSESTERTRSKRRRQSRSPPLDSENPPQSNDSHWVVTYERKGLVRFLDPRDGRREIKTERKDWSEYILEGNQCFHWACPESGVTFWATKLPKVKKSRR